MNIRTALPTEAPRRASFARLVGVETRKFVDTRLGIALVALIVLGAAAAMIGGVVWLDTDLTATIVLTGLPLGTLLPALGIIAVTTEWSRRTALSTFALEPRRARVLLAKCLPPVLVMLAAVALIVPGAYVVTMVAGGPLAVDLEVLGGWVVTCLILVLNGVGIAALVRNAAVAIVLCLAGGLYWGVIAMLGDAGLWLATWLDLNRTTSPLLEGSMTVAAVGPLAVSVLVWVVAPFAVGLWRLTREEIS